MSRSLGTHATQGINGDATTLQKWLDIAMRFAGPPEVCPYPRHRRTDWRLKGGGPVVCGTCHPPAGGLDIKRLKSAKR